jgi:hypothetical protein
VVNSPPTVSITSPSEGAAFTAPASVPVTANATDPDGTVSQVEFFSNGLPVGTVTTAPFALTLDNVAAGNYALTAKATDDAGASTTSAAVNIVVNQPTANNPPTISIVSPATGLTLAAPASVNLSDRRGRRRVGQRSRVLQGYWPGDPPGTREPLGTVSIAPYTLTVNDLPAGFYHIVAEATDNQGAKTTSSEAVVTIHTPLKIESISHANGETVLRVMTRSRRCLYPQRPSFGRSAELDRPKRKLYRRGWRDARIQGCDGLGLPLLSRPSRVSGSATGKLNDWSSRLREFDASRVNFTRLQDKSRDRSRRFLLD